MGRDQFSSHHLRDNNFQSLQAFLREAVVGLLGQRGVKAAIHQLWREGANTCCYNIGVRL